MAPQKRLTGDAHVTAIIIIYYYYIIIIVSLIIVTISVQWLQA